VLHKVLRSAVAQRKVRVVCCVRDVSTVRRQRIPFRVTTRDKEIVRWIARLRMATASQIADRFGLGRAVTYARLAGLVRLDLLQHDRIFHEAPGVYLATRAGIAAGSLELPASRIDLRTYAHDLELTSLVIRLEREHGEENIRTEREMRAMDTTRGSEWAVAPRFAVPMTETLGQLTLSPAGHRRLHFADCCVVHPGSTSGEGILAVELERSAKGRARLRRIVRAYVSARHVTGVRYYVSGARIHSLVTSEVAAQRANRLIDVRMWPALHQHEPQCRLAS
jgi:hypothetical protein